WEDAQDLRDEHPELFNPISNSSENQHRDSNSTKIVLIRQRTIPGDEDVEACVDRRPQQDAIAKTTPAWISHGGNVQCRELRFERMRYRFIDEYSQGSTQHLEPLQGQRSPAHGSRTGKRRETLPANRPPRDNQKGCIPARAYRQTRALHS